jgi:hypothetical protein
MEQGGHVGQDEAERGSPMFSGNCEATTDCSAEEVIGEGWAPVTGDIHGELLQLEEGEG